MTFRTSADVCLSFGKLPTPSNNFYTVSKKTAKLFFARTVKFPPNAKNDWYNYKDGKEDKLM